MEELALMEPQQMMGLATNVAEICAEIIDECSIEIGKGQNARAYLKCEGWQAIANAFGAVGSATSVEKVYDAASDQLLGFRAIGEVRRMKDNQLLTTAEGFVGVDEFLWFGGPGEVWNKARKAWEKKVYDPRPEFAIRSMAQTRAISKACRGAFAFVIILLNKKRKGTGQGKQFSTTPAEEMQTDDHGDGGARERPMRPEPEQREEPEGDNDYRNYVCTYGTKGGPLRGKQFGELTDSNLAFLYEEFIKSGREVEKKDLAMVEGLKLWKESRMKK